MNVVRKRADKRKLTDYQTEILISEVQARPSLWNDNDKNFKNIAVTRREWSEVGSQVNVSGDEAKTKWKNLKDTFRKLLTKPPQVPSGTGESFPDRDKPKWKHYEFMLFIKDVLQHSQTNGNLTSNEDKDMLREESDIEFNNDNDTKEFFEELQHCDSLENSSSRGTKRKDTCDTTENEYLQLEERRTEPTLSIQRDKQETGADYHFLMSLLPYIEELDPLEKLELRSKVQMCVTESYRKHVNKKHRSAPHQHNLNIFSQ
ncbi:uncharacterized protein [Periplaneta americana]|uniref:uncharacterized protein n=1 Tax=Periplaneta americana TaxID=6978 RepID=UPI0037E8D7F4